MVYTRLQKNTDRIKNRPPGRQTSSLAPYTGPVGEEPSSLSSPPDTSELDFNVPSPIQVAAVSIKKEKESSFLSPPPDSTELDFNVPSPIQVVSVSIKKEEESISLSSVLGSDELGVPSPILTSLTRRNEERFLGRSPEASASKQSQSEGASAYASVEIAHVGEARSKRSRPSPSKNDNPFSEIPNKRRKIIRRYGKASQQFQSGLRR